MVVLTDEQLAALRDVRAVWPDADLLLIGAQALAAHIDMSHRHTEDLDLAVAVSLAEFPAELPHRPGWEQHPKRTHHFISPAATTAWASDPWDRAHRTLLALRRGLAF